MLSVDIKTALVRLCETESEIFNDEWIIEKIRQQPDLVARLAVENVSASNFCIASALGKWSRLQESTDFLRVLCRQWTLQFPHRSRPIDHITVYLRRFRPFALTCACMDVFVAAIVQQALEVDGEADGRDLEHPMTQKLLAFMNELIDLTVTTSQSTSQVISAAFEQLYLRAHHPQIMGCFFFVYFSECPDKFIRRAKTMTISTKVDPLRRKNSAVFLAAFATHCTGVTEEVAAQVLRSEYVEVEQWKPFAFISLLGDSATTKYRESVELPDRLTDLDSSEIFSDFSDFNFEFQEFLDHPDNMDFADNIVLTRVLSSTKFKSASLSSI